MPLLGSLIKKAYELRQFPIDIRTINPALEQERVLKKLLTRAQNTAFGDYYRFSAILESGDVMAGFTGIVPVHDYGSMFKNWWYRSLSGEAYVTWPGQTRYFALTSGTSESSSKHIPVTSDMLRAIQKASIRQLISTTKYDFPDEFYEKGILMIGGSTHLRYNGAYYVGDLSGITASNMPFWFQHFYKPGKRISREQDWLVKLNEIARNAKTWDIGVIVGVPAWIQILLERIIAYYGAKNIHEVWPNLSAYVHSGVSFEPYVNSFEHLFGHPVLFNESYLASEGYIAYQRPGCDHAMEMILDNGIFYEFIPFTGRNFSPEGDLLNNPEVLTISQVETGVEYALLLSTCSGAWRYLIGDVIRFTSAGNCEIILTGRTKHFLNLCGEHLSQDNMNRAIKMLQDELNIKISEYAVAGVRHGTMFAHKWYLGTNDPVVPETASEKLDGYLKILNDDYRVERLEAIQKVSVEILPLQLFFDWMRVQGKEGGAHKFPRVLKKEQLINWEAFISSRPVKKA